MNKTHKFFSFNNMTNEEFAKMLDDCLPIDLRHNKDLIDRVINKYSQVDKIKVSIIILALFKAMRRNLMFNKTLTFSHLFSGCRIAIKRIYTNPSLKINLTTSDKIKKS